MRAATLNDLLKKGDRIAVSNITGREASKVSVISQQFCNNIVAGWALGKEDQNIPVGLDRDIPVFGQFEDLMKALPEKKKPNKIIVYSPPTAVYGEVKEVLKWGKDYVETIYVITEHVSIEVTAKLRRLCDLNNVDIIGCNTLGIIDAHQQVRIGAVGGDNPQESFIPGSATIISNSGNMVNTISSYLQSAGLGISFGISTGKDALILTPLKEFLALAEKDPKTKIIVLYCEPGGTYEREAIEFMKKRKTQKPMLVYVAGKIGEGRNISLGHAGAVVEGKDTSATAKMEMFDEYFGVDVFDPKKPEIAKKQLAEKNRGIRVATLHALVPAARVLIDSLKLKYDFTPKRALTLNPWMINLDQIAKKLPADLVPRQGLVPAPYDELIEKYAKSGLGRSVTRQSMRSTSHASSNDGKVPRVYGYSLLNLMEKHSFAYSVILYWLGHPPQHSFEEKLFEMCLIGSLTNGPGTISAQGAKLSASAGNDANTAMMATLGTIGTTHGGNGRKAAQMLVNIFADTGIKDPYSKPTDNILDKLAESFVLEFKKQKAIAKESGTDFEKVPCLGHPVFNTDPVNYDPRERVVSSYLKKNKRYNVFLDFYHILTQKMTEKGVTSKVHAVNVDAAITCVCMGIAWPLLMDKKITVDRVFDFPFATFALGRVAGGAGEYLDHRESGTGMDMRVPVSECKFLGREKD